MGGDRAGEEGVAEVSRPGLTAGVGCLSWTADSSLGFVSVGKEGQGSWDRKVHGRGGKQRCALCALCLQPSLLVCVCVYVREREKDLVYISE